MRDDQGKHVRFQEHQENCRDNCKDNFRPFSPLFRLSAEDPQPSGKQQDLQELWRELGTLSLATPNIGKLTDIIACPGLDFCALANARAIPVAQDIGRHFSDPAVLQDIGELTINISGCMNACGHHHVGHIGILGVEKNGLEFYQLTLGGSSGEDASLGDRLGRSISAAEVPTAIDAIVARYKALRLADERFLDTYRRVGIEPFKEAVYGPRTREVA
jgi:sulfite reductase (NADPH) hemoprotein beta-component